MKSQFHNLIQVKRIKDILGYEWSKSPNFMNGYSRKKVDGVEVLDVQIWKNNSKWDGMVEQVIADDGAVTMRIAEEHAEGLINDYCADNVFRGFIHSTIEIEREKMVRVRMGAGYSVRKMMKVVREPGYLYGQFKIVSVEQDNKSGDYVFVAKPQHIPA